MKNSKCTKKNGVCGEFQFNKKKCVCNKNDVPPNKRVIQ